MVAARPSRRTSFRAFGIVGALAASFGVTPAHADGVPAAGTTAPASSSGDAKTHFLAGVALLRDPGHPRFEEAYREFKEAYAISKSPKILGNVGLCAMKLERDAEAIDAYEQYLKGVPDIDAGERAQIDRDLLTLHAGLVRLDLEFAAPQGSVATGVTIVDRRVPTQGEAVTNFYGPFDGKAAISVRRGHHVVVARIAGKPDVSWEVDADSGPIAHPFAFQDEPAPAANPSPAGEPQRPVPTSVYVAGGVTVLLGVGTAVVGGLALAKHSDYQTKNDGNNPTAASDARQTGTTLNGVTDGLLVGTVIGALVTTVLYVTRPAESAPESATARLLHIAPSRGGLSLSF